MRTAITDGAVSPYPRGRRGSSTLTRGHTRLPLGAYARTCAPAMVRTRGAGRDLSR